MGSDTAEKETKEDNKGDNGRLGDIPIKRFHFLLLLLLGIGWALDAMSAGLISFSLTPLKNDLGLNSELVGFLLSAWNMGMFFGAFLLGGLGDKFGRKIPLILSMVLYSLPTGLIYFAGSWEVIFLLRFIAGMGSSSYMALGSTLMSEYSPRKSRGRWVAFLESAWAIGWLFASYFGLILIANPLYSWREVMLIGFLPLFFLIPLAIFIPESVRFLLEKGKDQEAEEILKQIGASKAKFSPKVKEEGTIKDLITKYRKRTIMLWVHWFSIVLTYWGIFLWLPNVLVDEKGLTIADSLFFAFLVTAAQIPGYWSGAWLIEIIGRKKLLSIYMTLAGIASFFFALSTVRWQVLLFASLISFFNLGAWGATYSYTPELYPTSLRATGSGAANSVGRLGGIVGPILAGVLAGFFGSFYYVFIVFTVFHFISAIIIALLGTETMGRPLD